jgi:hypothetical protein
MACSTVIVERLLGDLQDIGQRIIIEPAEGLLIARFGRAQDWPEFDARGMVRLVAEANALPISGEPALTAAVEPSQSPSLGDGSCPVSVYRCRLLRIKTVP